MKVLAALAVSLMLGGCAGTPPMAPADDLFHDEVFAASHAPIDASAALAVSPAMREYLAGLRSSAAHGSDRRQRLVDALYRGDLKLEYDAERTRTAAEAFDARSGNCLALVLMTAAFAKELGLVVRYQAVLGASDWSREDELVMSIGHVNLVLEEPTEPIGFIRTSTGPLIVDFLPPADAWRLRTRVLDEPTVVAMYLNNRAVESLTHGDVDAAYRFARAAIRADPGMVEAYVTLGVVYRSARHPEFAEAVLRRVTERDPGRLDALSNRIVVLRDLGRAAEADALSEQLALRHPQLPFVAFRQGMLAMQEGRFDAARRFFAQEAERAPQHAEFQYWLAVSCAALNDVDAARLHLQRALAASTTRRDHALYAAKLDRLKPLRTQ